MHRRRAMSPVTGKLPVQEKCGQGLGSVLGAPRGLSAAVILVPLRLPGAMDTVRFVIAIVVDVPLVGYACKVPCPALRFGAFVVVMFFGHGYPPSRVPS